MDFFVSYSEQDREFERVVSQALAPHGTVTGRATVETGGLELIQRWAAERGGRPLAVISLISASYLERGREIANTLRTDSLVWIDVYLESVERSPAALLRRSIPLDGLDRERATLNLETYFDALLDDPDLFAPIPLSGSTGMTSGGPEPLSLGEMLERRGQAEAYHNTLASALEAPNFSANDARPAPMPLPMAPQTAPPPPPSSLPRRLQRPAGSRGWIDWLLIGGAVLLAAFALKDWLGHLLIGAGAVSQGIAQPVPPPAGRVDVSAFAPEGGAPGDKVLVQVLLHAQADIRRAAREARLADPAAGRRMTATLTQDIAPGQIVTVMLEGAGLAVDEPVQRIVWRGEPAAVQFLVQLPVDLGYAYVRCLLLVDTMPVGSLRFALRVTEAAVDRKIEMRGDDARRYRRAFLSYASADRPEVLKRAQGLRAAGIDFFQDILSLEPGEQWERRLYDEIDRCDLFLLFWSSNAAASEWVKRETDRAVARQHDSTVGVPEITPVIIEGPPVASPIPSALRHLHFNDYVMLAALSETRPHT